MARGETYEEFTAKFEPKRTTDDCYTPPEVYDCVLRWAHREYGFDLAKVARPFYPGGDYEREEYPQGCTVVDNPPFSILSKIVKHYQERGVGFFLFAPTLTCMGIRNCCKVVTGVGVTYANGASVNTSFVTNLDPAQARSAPDLRSELDAAIERLRREKAKALPKYEYPDEVLTAPMLARYSSTSAWGRRSAASRGRSTRSACRTRRYTAAATSYQSVQPQSVSRFRRASAM